MMNNNELRTVRIVVKKNDKQCMPGTIYFTGTLRLSVVPFIRQLNRNKLKVNVCCLS